MRAIDFISVFSILLGNGNPELGPYCTKVAMSGKNFIITVEHDSAEDSASFYNFKGMRWTINI